MMQVSWQAFKSHIQGNTDAYPQKTEDADNVYMFSRHGFQCTVNKRLQGDDYAEIAALAATFNKQQQSRVVTEFEISDKVARLAKITGEFDINGECVLELQVPGSFSLTSPGRLVAEAYCIEDVFGWGDAVTTIELIDKDNLSGLGANTVLETFHDPDVALANRGWYFYPTFGGAGELEVSPIGGFGELIGGTYLRATFKKAVGSTAQKVIACIWWGEKIS